jgi:steroid delta-isomerase-like uncharacterized protein
MCREEKMSTTTNKAICRRHYEEVLTSKKIGVVDEIYADQIAYGETQSMPREQFKMLAKASTTAFPDLKVTIHAQVAEGDCVVTRWSADGTHLGDFMGNKPTGKGVHIQAIHVHKIVDGRICHLWEQIDLLSLSKQLGITIG